MAGSGALLRQCPLLLPQNREGSVYEGFVTVQDRDFHIRILLPSDFQLKNARIHCSWRLKKVLHGYHQIVKQRLQHCSDLVSFMVEFKTILEAALKNAQELHAPPPPEYYSYLVRDIETLGWNKVVYVDTGLNTIKLKGEDSCGRQHLITLKLNAKYPAEPPDCCVDFPVEFAISWIPQSSLVDIYSQFLAALESLKEFWNAMDEIDEKTWVLEPENPTRSATMRRIAVGNNVSINLEVDPRHPTMLPECYFLGADHVVNPLRTKLNNNMHLWDPDTTLLQNLKEVLEIDFPSRAVLEKTHMHLTKDAMKQSFLQDLKALADRAIPEEMLDDLRYGRDRQKQKRTSLWIVVSAMLTDLMVLFQTRCVVIPDVDNLSIRLACLSGYKVFLLADKVLMSSLVNVHIVTSQSR
ncbi:E3 ubiquitin-protein ligase FANCL isoform X2 [Mauremys reevesii]|uniref:E3 ubiquitin-protein ligase FANCL isoform X2 n=1 Tax=Mauremys reevesii TaxID=260615 RepID=UPI00193F7F93|nr:E3 ubiquitin-protein ligase FANCL isoform X2 [Mauremys reevesii]